MSEPLDTFVKEIGVCRTRNDAAAIYAKALRLWAGSYYVGAWEGLNKAILDRWSRSGLIFIKEKAWKLAAAPPERAAREAERT